MKRSRVGWATASGLVWNLPIQIKWKYRYKYIYNTNTNIEKRSRVDQCLWPGVESPNTGAVDEPLAVTQLSTATPRYSLFFWGGIICWATIEIIAPDVCIYSFKITQALAQINMVFDNYYLCHALHLHLYAYICTCLWICTNSAIQDVSHASTFYKLCPKDIVHTSWTYIQKPSQQRCIFTIYQQLTHV